MSEETINGAKILIKSLLKEGVEVVFGLPGGAIIKTYDELMLTPGLKHVLVRHEQGAVHMAQGYARASGKVGVVMVTSGPGATNCVTGIADAYMDSTPIVVITGQVPVPLIGNDAFQEADTIGITRPITKHSYLIKDVRNIARSVKEAFYICRTGRPGPIVIDLPKDVQASSARFDYPKEVDIRGYDPVLEGHPGQIRRAAELISRAKQPVLYIGGGVGHSNAGPEILALAEKMRIPVTSTLMGLGSFPGDHDLFLGMLGMHGTWYANTALDTCDVMITIGARFDDRATGKLADFGKQATIIHIDIDPSAISKNVHVDIPIVGDVKSVVRQLLEHVKPGEMKSWLSEIAKWKKEHPLAYRNQGEGLKPQFVLQELSRLTKGDSIITTDVGQHQMWAAQYYRTRRPRSFITSGGLGTMGFGYPAAIGAAFARPGEPVINVSGDGSFQMNLQEIATAVEHKLPVKAAILNNGYLGMVRQWQQLFYDRRYSHTQLDITNPDFVKLAEAYGCLGIRVSRPEEVEPLTLRALKEPGPVIIDYVVDKEENVFPMVPAGAANKDMIEDVHES
ncbi:MAG: biosynthetic-type acetolactate synthase large subunit [Acidobacteriota bacterium]|nr:biosynthetic-type acetolactate synthase large subunit [Acidobacteriota bacterium]